MMTRSCRRPLGPGPVGSWSHSSYAQLPGRAGQNKHPSSSPNGGVPQNKGDELVFRSALCGNAAFHLRPPFFFPGPISIPRSSFQSSSQTDVSVSPNSQAAAEILLSPPWCFVSFALRSPVCLWSGHLGTRWSIWEGPKRLA